MNNWHPWDTIKTPPCEILPLLFKMPSRIQMKTFNLSLQKSCMKLSMLACTMGWDHWMRKLSDLVIRGAIIQFKIMVCLALSLLTPHCSAPIINKILLHLNFHNFRINLMKAFFEINRFCNNFQSTLTNELLFFSHHVSSSLLIAVNIA